MNFSKYATDKVVGLTSTVPVEIVYAAGLKPVDINNIFITSHSPEQLIREAEAAGFANNICNWIKGGYSTVLQHGIKTVIAMTGGDCSNHIALGELLAFKGVKVIHFQYPLDRSRDYLQKQMENLRAALSTSWSEIVKAKSRLDKIRFKLNELDRLTYQENVVTGFENHIFMVSSSDFNSDPEQYEKDLDNLLQEVKQRKPRRDEIRLGYLGVPPILSQFYETIESLGGRVVFNEIQRQFSMPYQVEDLTEQYLVYTYPYDIQGRIQDIKKAVQERALDGLIHYTQTFCYRQIYDIILRENFKIPILTLEGDRPGKADARIAIRLETFIEMLRDRKTP
jgi:benzoyl-CoA reductase/2-hydroxyglutaryl-CoA dehydratase subunit BcrC/BadD/HgdB